MFSHSNYLQAKNMLDLRHAAAARLEFLSPGKRPREQMRRDTIPSSELEAGFQPIVRCGAKRMM